MSACRTRVTRRLRGIPRKTGFLGNLPNRPLALANLPITRLYGQYKERSASVWMRKGFIPALRSELGTLPCDLPCGHRLKVLRRTKVFFDLLRSRIVA
jgi:hypothetical protein